VKQGADLSGTRAQQAARFGPEAVRIAHAQLPSGAPRELEAAGLLNLRQEDDEMSKSTSRDTRNETLATLPPGQWRIHFSDFRTMRFWHEDEPAHASVRWNRRFPGRSTIQFADGGSIMLELWLQSRPAEHRPRAATLYELAKEAGRKAKATEAGTSAVEPATQDCGCRAAARR
jgi:hypothetical protein